MKADAVGRPHKAKGRKGAATHAQCIAAVEVLEQRVAATRADELATRDAFAARIATLHDDLRKRTAERDERQRESEMAMRDMSLSRVECARLAAQRDDDQKIIRALNAEVVALRQGMEDQRNEAIRAREEAHTLRQNLAKSMAQTEETLATARDAVEETKVARADAEAWEETAQGWADRCADAAMGVGKWCGHATMLAALVCGGKADGARDLADLIRSAEK